MWTGQPRVHQWTTFQLNTSSSSSSSLETVPTFSVSFINTIIINKNKSIFVRCRFYLAHKFGFSLVYTVRDFPWLEKKISVFFCSFTLASSWWWCTQHAQHTTNKTIPPARHGWKSIAPPMFSSRSAHVGHVVVVAATTLLLLLAFSVLYLSMFFFLLYIM